MSAIRTDRALCLAAGLLVCALLTPAVALADGTVVDWVKEVKAWNTPGTDQTIRVASNGVTYTEVTDGKLDLRAKGYVLCKAPTHVGRSLLYVDRLVGGGRWTLNDYYDPGYKKQRSYERTETKSVDLAAAERQIAVGACKKLMTTLVNQGRTVREVLSQDRVAYGANLFEVGHYVACDAKLTNSADERATAPVLTPVLCQKSDFPPPAGDLPRPGGLQQRFGLTGAELSVTPDHGSVYGHARLTVTGKLTANGDGQAKIRVGHNGTLGPVTTIAFANAGTEELSFPLNVPCPSGNGGGGGNGIGGLVAAPPSSTISGHLEIQVVAPAAGVRKSNRAFYNFTCKPTGTVTSGLPDLVVRLERHTTPAFRAVVRNAGSAPSTPTKLEVRVGTKVQSLPVPAIGAGQEVSIGFGEPGNASQLEVPVQATVDKPPVVQELNEGNNSASL